MSEISREATAAVLGNSTGRNTGEHKVTITYPSRLIYYLNEESESTDHDLDTLARNQAGDGQVRHGLSCSVKIPSIAHFSPHQIQIFNAQPLGAAWEWWQ